MYQNIKKMIMLFFVAATMFSFASCNKDDDNNGSGGGSSTISEAKLIGKWSFNDGVYSHFDITINADHTCYWSDYNCIWTLSGNKFHGQDTHYDEDYGREITICIDFTIKSLTDDTMVIEGKRTYEDGSQGDYSGTLHKVQ